MAIQHAILALLRTAPNYGYVLKAQVAEAVGEKWGSLNMGNIYHQLRRLSDDGFVRVIEKVSSENRPDRLVYGITPEGERELQDWLFTPIDPSGGYRDEFILKIFAASHFGPDAVRQVCVEQRRVYQNELASLRVLRRQHKDEPLAALTIEAAMIFVQGRLTLIASVDEKADTSFVPVYDATSSATAADADDDAGEQDDLSSRRSRRIG